MAARVTQRVTIVRGWARPQDGPAEETDQARMKEGKKTKEEDGWSDLLELYTSMSSRSSVLKDALAPSVLARTFSTWPLSEPRKTTVWFL